MRGHGHIRGDGYPFHTLADWTTGSRLFECPDCASLRPWTDGRSKRAGDEVNEYWCQACGAETPLSDAETERLQRKQR